MFGYITIDKPELKIKHFELFQCYYCGLCGRLQEKYTKKGSFLLNYDLTFLYIFLAGISEQDISFDQIRCLGNPTKKKKVALHPCLDYVAAANLLLGVLKMKDDVSDNKSLAKKAAFQIYKRQLKKATAAYSQMASQVEEQLAELAKLEGQKCSSIDQVADVFAKLLGELFQNSPVEADGRVLYQVGYHLGRWIYLIDAYDDLKEDLEEGSYNPYIEKYGKDAIENDKIAIKHEVEEDLVYTLANGALAYEMLRFYRNKDLLDNIIYLGLKKKTYAVLNGCNHKRSRKQEHQNMRKI